MQTHKIVLLALGVFLPLWNMGQAAMGKGGAAGHLDEHAAGFLGPAFRVLAGEFEWGPRGVGTFPG